jgi:cation diffusion facilitator CzcD-associated flavoprotein CzcO
MVSAVGGLVEPRAWPEDVPGKETFEGDIFQSARWNHNVELAGKDVIVIGTGCSTAQFVPLFTKALYRAKSVTQVMRSPPWVGKRPGPPGGGRILC